MIWRLIFMTNMEISLKIKDSKLGNVELLFRLIEAMRCK